MIHNLKIKTKYLDEIYEGIKTFEIRFNDRNFKVGDTLHLRGFDDGEYTGEGLYRDITYILDDPEYVKEGFVIMGIK